MPSVTTDGVSVNGNSANLHGSWHAFIGSAGDELWFQFGIGGLDSETGHQGSGFATDGSFSAVIGTSFDRTYHYRAKGIASYDINLGGAELTFQSFAEALSFGTPVVNSVSATDANISCLVNVRVVESTADVRIEYKRSVDSSWTVITIASGTQTDGTYAKTLTGLLSSTSYDVRFSVSRGTANNPNGTSGQVSFVTSSADLAVLHL